jgi:hypothetical protein
MPFMADRLLFANLLVSDDWLLGHFASQAVAGRYLVPTSWAFSSLEFGHVVLSSLVVL